MRRLRSLHKMIFCGTAILCATSVHSQSFNKSYAVLIAVNDYQHPTRWPHLDYPEKDAKAFGDFLAGQGFVLKAFYGPAAKKQAILSYMTDKLAPDLGQNDRVLVFFAGHGHTGMLGGKKRGYIVPYDGDSSSSLISMDELQDESGDMGNAKHQLFLIDSCFGGLLARPRDSIVSPEVPHYIEDISERVARQVLTAGGENEVVLDNGPNGHSVFMDALLEALKDGKADVHGYGYITFSDLVAYIVPRVSNKYQTPAPGYLPGHQLGEFWFRNPKGPKRAVESIPIPAVARVRSDAAGRTPEQYVAAGDARWFAGDYDGAAEQYRVAIQIRPDYAEAHSSLGVTLSSKGDWDGDIQEQKEAIRLKPDYSEAHHQTGKLLTTGN